VAAAFDQAFGTAASDLVVWGSTVIRAMSAKSLNSQ